VGYDSSLKRTELPSHKKTWKILEYIFVTIHEPTLTHHYHPKSVVYIMLNILWFWINV